jgi:hypothetical protein
LPVTAIVPHRVRRPESRARPKTTGVTRQGKASIVVIDKIPSALMKALSDDPQLLTVLTDCMTSSLHYKKP